MSDYNPTPQQEQAIREYLHESIVPLIEQVLVKKLGQAMSYAAEQLIQPKREWVGLTDEEIEQGNKESWVDKQAWESAVWWAEAKLKQKNGYTEEKNT